MSAESLYVYGIVRADAQNMVRDTLSAGDTPLSLVPYEGIGAVVSSVEAGSRLTPRELMTAHARVLDKLNSLGTVVPVRVGQLMADSDAVLAEVLQPDASRLEALLASLEGRDQFVARAMYNEPIILAEIVEENPEVARLRERTRKLPPELGQAERLRLGELVSSELDVKRGQDGSVFFELVGPYAASHVLRESSDMHRLLEAAFLVDEDCRQGFEEALEAVAEMLAGRARVQLLGPMPPYDFVGE